MLFQPALNCLLYFTDTAWDVLGRMLIPTPINKHTYLEPMLNIQIANTKVLTATEPLSVRLVKHYTSVALKSLVF